MLEILITQIEKIFENKTPVLSKKSREIKARIERLKTNSQPTQQEMENWEFRPIVPPDSK